MQDAIVIAVAFGAALWLARRTIRRLLAPGCGGPATDQSGSPAFVPVERLVITGTRPLRHAPREPAP